MPLTSIETALSLGHILFAAALFFHLRGRRQAALLSAALACLGVLLVLFRFSLQSNLDSPLLALSLGTKLLAALVFYLFGWKTKEIPNRYFWGILVFFFLMAGLLDGQARLYGKNPIRNLHSLAWWGLAFFLIFSKDAVFALALIFWTYLDLFSIGSGVYLTGLLERKAGLQLFVWIVYFLPALLAPLLYFVKDKSPTTRHWQMSLFLFFCTVQMLLHLYGI